MNADTLRREAELLLAAAGIENSAQEARWIVTETLGLTPLALLTKQQLTEEQCACVRARLRRRAAREPLQYVLGTAPFRMLNLAVTPDVLIPRPETEELAEWVIRRLPRGGSLLDLGTGSGAIALAVASERPDARVTATDVSPAALAVAEKNAAALGLPVRFRPGSLFGAVPGERFHIVAANLPYVREEELAGLEPEVRDHEPRLALVAREEGLELIRRCIEELPEHLHEGGGAIFEMSPDQIPAACALLREQGFAPEILRDRFGRDRFAGVPPAC